MPVVAPARYTSHPKPHRRKPIIRLVLGALFMVAIINYMRPLPAPTAALSVSVPSSTINPSLPWPGAGQTSVAAAGYGLLGTYGVQKPLATASMAKVITALCVLQKQPLVPGQSGPTYTIGARDVALYQHYAAQDGSLIPVTEGETLTEYQALQALMIPSANNIADSLVQWVFGGQQAYAMYATTFLQQHSITGTHIGSDASGFEPDTTSTASDLANLGLLALKSPVLMDIARQRAVNLPVAGTVYNYNTVIGQNGITGLKTGNSDADPGAFLFTATAHVGDKDILLTGAVMGQSDLNSALSSAARLSTALGQGFEQVQIASAGQTVGHFVAAWGAHSDIVSKTTVKVIRWKATPVTETHVLHTDVRSGTVGQLKLAAGQAQTDSQLLLAHSISGPSFWWRLTRH